MQTLGISPAWYLPLSTLALSYLKADKNRHDRKAAIQIVSDYEVPYFPELASPLPLSPAAVCRR
jgi:hypothetical protein